MKWLFRLMTALVLLAAIGLPFFINNQKGEPMLSLPSKDDFLPGTQSAGGIPLPATTTQVFKWQDKDGTWHYGDQPPAGMELVETVEVDSRTNVIQGFRSAEPQPSGSARPALANQMTPADEGILSLDRAMNAMKDAKLAAEMMEQRNEHLNKIVGDQE